MPVTIDAQQEEPEAPAQEHQAGSERKADVVDLVQLADAHEKRLKAEEQVVKEREELARWLEASRGPLCEPLELGDTKVQAFTKADCSVELEVTDACGTEHVVHFSAADMLSMEPTERFSSEFRPFGEEQSRARRRIRQLETMQFRLCMIDDDNLLLWAHESRDPAQEGCAPRTAFLVA